MNSSAGVPRRTVRRQVSSPHGPVPDGEHFIGAAEDFFFEHRRHRSNRCNGDVRVRQPARTAASAGKAMTASPSQFGARITRRFGNPCVRFVLVCCSHCSRGPTPARSRSAASRLARAAGAVSLPFPFSLFPFPFSLSTVFFPRRRRPCHLSRATPTGTCLYVALPAGTSRQRRCIQSHSSG